MHRPPSASTHSNPAPHDQTTLRGIGTNPVTVPVNGCSASIKVSAGQITVTEIEQVDFYTASQLVGILSAYNAGTASGAPGPCASSSEPACLGEDLGPPPNMLFRLVAPAQRVIGAQLPVVKVPLPVLSGTSWWLPLAMRAHTFGWLPIACT